MRKSGGPQSRNPAVVKATTRLLVESGWAAPARCGAFEGANPHLGNDFFRNVGATYGLARKIESQKCCGERFEGALERHGFSFLDFVVPALKGRSDYLSMPCALAFFSGNSSAIQLVSDNGPVLASVGRQTDDEFDDLTLGRGGYELSRPNLEAVRRRGGSVIVRTCRPPLRGAVPDPMLVKNGYDVGFRGTELLRNLGCR
jgi:hypothetical protein